MASGPISPSPTPAGTAFLLPWRSRFGWQSMTSGRGTKSRRPWISARSALIWHHSMIDAWSGSRPRHVEMMPLKSGERLFSLFPGGRGTGFRSPGNIGAPTCKRGLPQGKFSAKISGLGLN